MDFTSFLWAILLAIAAFGGGSAYGVLGMSPARYREAKILFWISGLAIGAIAIMFGLTVPISSIGRLAGTGIIGALAAILIVESTRWVANIEMAAKVVPENVGTTSVPKEAPNPYGKTLHDLYNNDDFPIIFGMGMLTPLMNASGKQFNVEWTLRYDFNGGSIFPVFYIPDTADSYNVISGLAKITKNLVANTQKSVVIGTKTPGNSSRDTTKDLKFLGRVVIYSLHDFGVEGLGQITRIYRDNDLAAQIRSNDWLILRRQSQLK